ncbi:Hypothetical protein PP7435_CHR1-1288 [Komagataella phaffii CBS 7435]|uniref:Hap4 transcription factor heteromerisation domain-containing protein n=2 Tax=Komagataella phaffii TaxID=460519 RepID=C4QYL5_KOMPG|nr:Hypothetical protein PAS_chr1-4_0486 [Komagataella phaffii GS115]AOA61591.1 GQ67_01665T0 [Komagataella phaffii]CAH2447163.1 Hypothetical protein BQ9382_C1-6730 [Komagataella phaffii CBS 7435]AOA66578.1 GQ68_01680T0 [Komagataella phaffii GS115]CAY68339.1 Hypothetical protein PAS_chr1-4_0486 [Komagataella phaffii GS115]CCA37407.1 Hypothetical protein PP7435_CHR1-1288 [Komagataella phaffii CBS 7435]
MIKQEPREEGVNSHQTPSRVPLSIAVKPGLPAIAPKKPIQVLPKLYPMSKTVSTQSTKGSIHDEKQKIMTSKQWVLPPRPKPGRKPTDESYKHKDPVKSGCNASRVKRNGALKKKQQQHHHQQQQQSQPQTNQHRDTRSQTPELGFDARIHSNIDIITDDKAVLHAQLHEATRENGNLKKVIDKLNQEISTLKLLKLEYQASPHKKKKCSSAALSRSSSSPPITPTSTESHSVYTFLDPSRFDIPVLTDTGSTTIDPVKISFLGPSSDSGGGSSRHPEPLIETTTLASGKSDSGESETSQVSMTLQDYDLQLQAADESVLPSGGLGYDVYDMMT